jgi:nucleoside-diphosphate-sugar epimerase
VKPRVLVTGSEGQIGSELTHVLRERYGTDNVVAGTFEERNIEQLGIGPREHFDVTSQSDILEVVRKHEIDTIYHLAAVLSALGENNPQLAWTVNMQGLKNVLDVARETGATHIFWPSSIAVFGTDAPKKMASQAVPLNPSTMYGITKVSGELLCNYYHKKYGVDVRCVRYPGLISNKTRPGGGTTDYAVDMFYSALEKGTYQCFVREDTVLPMMYMPDALRASVEIMEAPPKSVARRTGYNLAATSFSAGQLAAEIRKHVQGFRCTYVPDFRQQVADSWPESIDDTEARRDWGWFPRYNLEIMSSDMISSLSVRLKGK